MEWLTITVYGTIVISALVAMEHRSEKERYTERVSRSRTKLQEDIAECGHRIEIERRCDKIRRERIAKKKPPYRKACGYFSDMAAQNLLK